MAHAAPLDNRRVTTLAATLAALALIVSPGSAAPAAGQGGPALAVFPIENLSGVAIPLDGIRQAVTGALAARGVGLLPEADLDAFLRRHRVRYTAGVDGELAEKLQQETGATGALVVTVELSSDAQPPKVAVLARLVSLEAPPLVTWSDGAGLAGDDAPGLFDLGLVQEYGTLLARALDRLTESLARHLETGAPAAAKSHASRFRPRMSFRSPALDAGRTYTLAVLPFHNASTRRHAGDIVALHFVRHLAGVPQFRVVDPGVVRRELLSARIIMDAGPSLGDAETLAALVDADLVLGGRVLTYQDVDGPDANPRVEFSAVLIDRKTRRVVWGSDSYNEGHEGAGFFDRGRSRTAHAMATQMVGHTAAHIAGRER